MAPNTTPETIAPACSAAIHASSTGSRLCRAVDQMIPASSETTTASRLRANSTPSNLRSCVSAMIPLPWIRALNQQ